MKRHRLDRIVAILLLGGLYRGLAMTGICTAIAGCSRGPTAVGVPNYDPAGSAERAIQEYDLDGDGVLSESEYANSPSLKATIKMLDTDQDGKISAAEISQRIESWQQKGFGLMTITCEATLDNSPLGEATITFVPEEFLGGTIQEAVGVTSGIGSAYPTVPKDKRPSADSPPGIQAGFYKVLVSKTVNGKEIVPAKYNSATTLGQQVAMDDPAVLSKRVVFNLSSK